MSLGPGYDEVLSWGYDINYPRIDFMLGPMFFQASISSIGDHDTGSAEIRRAFDSRRKEDRKNQIEQYLDEMFGEGNSAMIDEDSRFVVTNGGKPVPGFRIVYNARQFR
ncbi:hypothetical protein EDD21DRAFT_358744 [Dissophora ornata]|nr:hypothetical protein EDD21DRAFT_358744 [Dissophora ornata]